MLIPTIEIAEPSSYAPLDDALTHLSEFDWLLFTSANAVEAFRRRVLSLDNASAGVSEEERVRERFSDAQQLRVAAIGPSTARAVESLGRRADLVPEKAVAESLLAELTAYARQPDGSSTRFLLVRAEVAREVLADTLRNAGGDVTIAPAYRTEIAESSVAAIQTLFSGGEAGEEGRIEAITFTSSSSARNLFALFEAAGVTLPAEVVFASIGPITSDTLRELGHPADIESPTASVAALAESIASLLLHRSSEEPG